MARKCKCKICKTQLTTDIAYCITLTTTKTPKNVYYCSEQEYRQEQSDIHFWKQCQYATDDILGYPIVNNNRNKHMSEIISHGYTREQLHECISEQSEYIKKCLGLRQDIESENHKLSYMFAIIKNSIRDITEKNKSKLNKTMNVSQVSEVDESLISDLIHTEYVKPVKKKPQRQTLMDKLKKHRKD